MSSSSTFEATLEGREPELQALSLRLRDWIAQLYPQSVQLVYDGYAASVAFTHTGKLGGAFAHIAVYENHLNLGFNEGALLDDHHGLLKGTGKNIRHLRIQDWDSFPDEKVRALLAQAAERTQMARSSASAPSPKKSKR